MPLDGKTTASVFGKELHSYVITHAIRDEKVLKFKVDYNNIRLKFKKFETEQYEKEMPAKEFKETLLNPERIKAISQYILRNFNAKTHRRTGNKGFNAMFAVSSIEAAKKYYETLRELQDGSKNPLKIATIFSFVDNEKQDAEGDIQDESFNVSDMGNKSDKEFLTNVIKDYNASFGTNYSVDNKEFENYYRDLAKRVKNRKLIY